MSVYIPRDKTGKKKSKVYLYDFKLRPKGAQQAQRFYGSTGQSTETAARRVETRLKELAKTGELSSTVTVAEACHRMWDEKYEHSRSADTSATNLEVVSTFLGAETLLVDVTPDLISRAAATRLRTPIQRYNRQTKRKEYTKKLPSPSTVNRQLLEPARALLRRARLVWKVPVDLNQFDWAELMLEEPEEISRELTQSEEIRYWKALRDDYHPIVEMYLISGRRRSDWVKLDRNRVDLLGGTIRVPSLKKKKRGEIVVRLTKREIEIIAEQYRLAPTCQYVFTYVVQRGPLKGQRAAITEPGLRRAHETARKAANIPNFRIHDCRHTFASRLLREKGNVKLLSKALNHSDIASTARYLHVLDQDVVDARADAVVYRHSTELSSSDVVIDGKKKFKSKG